MKNLKNMMAATLMAAVLMVGTTFAGTGMLLSDFAGQQNSCGQTTEQTNGGIIVAGFTGIIVAGFTGIIVAGLNGSNENSRNQTSCRDGMLLSD